MANNDDTLRRAVQKAQALAEGGPPPDFPNTWSAAVARAAERRRRHGFVVATAAAAAIAAVAFGLLRSPELEWQYVDSGELLGSTSWSAPSDSLLPEHQFDIYQEYPLLIESTDTYGGTLL